MVNPGLKSLVGVDVVVAVAAPIAAMRLPHWPLQAGAAVIGVWTFFVVWAIQQSAKDSHRNRTAIRDAIASAFVASFLATVSWGIFACVTTPKGAVELDPLTQTLVPHFAYLTGIVVAAHFGAGALETFGAQRSEQQPVNTATVSPSPSETDT